MQTFAAFFTQDHAQCDNRFADAEDAVSRQDWARADTVYPAFRQAMAHHFAMEENVLFPAFEAATGQVGGPTQVMRGEHVQMNDLLDNMSAALAARERDRFLGLAETLLWLMRQHNMKEENILYPMCDQALGAQKSALLRTLGEDMNAAAGNDDIVIDARDLPPPEPMEKVLQVLGLKRPGQAVRLLIHRQPYPLYELLDQQHYQHLTRTLDDGNFEVVIRDRPNR